MKRRAACIAAIRSLHASKEGSEDAGHLLIESDNSFPTAAGLASSAAGYASLVFSLSNAYNLGCTPTELSALARQGSGSACRSLMGGFVKWEMGSLPDGTDSFAVQVADELHWPEVCVVVAVVSDRQKTTSSTAGMQTSVNTSPLLKASENVYRHAHYCYLTRLRLCLFCAHSTAPRPSCLRACWRWNPQSKVSVASVYIQIAGVATYKPSAFSRILPPDKDFEAVGRLTMMDSNQFHATCLDTYPPISYLTSTSHAIQRLVHGLNDDAGSIKAAYTFDAGPNACILTLKQDVPALVALLCSHFGPSPGTSTKAADFLHGPCTMWQEMCGVDPSAASHLPVGPETAWQSCMGPTGTHSDSVKYLMLTNVGGGPEVESQ